MKTNKLGQVTIFIILAIILVAGLIAFFVFRDSTGAAGIPSNVEPIYTSFLTCIEQETQVGINVLESQAGYIYAPEFETGSAYSPFGSQLNFFGNRIPYWYYVSGNNMRKEQVPTKKLMEEQLEQFLEDKIVDCSFDRYYERGFEIIKGVPSFDVNIKDSEVSVTALMDLNIYLEDESYRLEKYSVDVKSQLGELYKSALNVYEQEQDEFFLEKYGIDALRLYAPVDGVELTCSPLTWEANKVYDELQEAIEINTISLRNENANGVSDEKYNGYFLLDLNTDQEVRFFNSKNWSSSFEVNPTQGSLMIAKPVGNQPGLGILGFCYVPYHFVYDVNYPVMIQVGDIAGEYCQFPVAISIRGNMPRDPLDARASGVPDSGICENKNTLTEVRVYDNKLNPVDARISYECFDDTCEIGETIQGGLKTEFPQCVNGFIVVDAQGYEINKYLYTSIDSGSAEIIIDKLYEMPLLLKIDGNPSKANALITFASDDGSSRTIIYPEQDTVELSEGQYEIMVQVFSSSSLKIGASEQEYCMDVPSSGVGAIFGTSTEKCYSVEMPEQVLSNVLAGGGKENYYILESELESSEGIEISADALPKPTTIEKLQENYIIFESKELGVAFK